MESKSVDLVQLEISGISTKVTAEYLLFPWKGNPEGLIMCLLRVLEGIILNFKF